jgi:hypothetical protein
MEDLTQNEKLGFMIKCLDMARGYSSDPEQIIANAKRIYTDLLKAVEE